MKICILVNDFKKPWAEAGKNNARAISRELAKRNEIFFIGCSDETVSFDFEGSQVYLFKSWFYNTVPARIFFIQGYTNLVFKAGKIIKKEKPDIILSWFETASTCFFSFLVKLFARSKAKLIHAVWTDWYCLPKLRRPSHFLTEHLPHFILNNRLTSRTGLYFADEIIATSRYLADRVESLGFSKIHFIPGGVDTKIFNPCFSPIIATCEKTVIGYVGHLSHTKGVSLLIEAILPMLEKEDLRLIMAVTDGEEEKIVRKLDHPRITVFNIIEPPAIYNACDLVIIPRRFSYGTASYPNVALEAMSCEVPVLCSDLPAMNEIVFENRTGFFFEPNDMNALRKRIKELIKDKKLLRQVGKNARKMVKKNLDWKDISLKIEELLKKISP